MNTAERVAEIQQGSRVVYAIGGVEYNGIALSAPHFGYNNAVRVYSAFLNLIYLNEQGTPIKIFSAPLLGTEADDDHLNVAAAVAAKKDSRYQYPDPNLTSDAANQRQKDIADLHQEHFDRLKANPRTIGWRPGDVGDGHRGFDGSGSERWLSGSGSGRWPHHGWPEAGDGTNYPGLPNQAQADAVVAQGELERSYKRGPFEPAAAAGRPIPVPSEGEENAARAVNAAKLDTLAAEGNPLAQVTREAKPSDDELKALADKHQEVAYREQAEAYVEQVPHAGQFPHAGQPVPQDPPPLPPDPFVK